MLIKFCVAEWIKPIDICQIHVENHINKNKPTANYFLWESGPSEKNSWIKWIMVTNSNLYRIKPCIFTKDMK